MDNYKIKVKDEAESKEAQELFFELGAVWGRSKKASFNSEPMSFIYLNGSTLYYGHDDENDEGWFKCEESGKELTLPQLRELVAQSKKDQGLISGAEALRALADGKEVEYFDKLNSEWDSDTSILPVNVFTNGSVKFRLKPQTIKFELEIPKPFEPKNGQKYWYLKAALDKGYDWALLHGDGSDFDQFGAWATEEEVKQVVEQLRKIRGAS